MEAIAENPYRFEVRPEVPAVYDTKGRVVAPAQRRVFIQFERGNAPAYTHKAGLAAFEFATKPTYEGGSEFPSELWLCYYNTEASQQIHDWTDEERAAIESHLPSCSDILIVERPKLAAPWPAYDKLVAGGRGVTSEAVAEKIARKVAEDGYDVGAVAAYERENRNRPDVIAALEALLIEEPAEAEPDPLVAA